MRYLLISSDGVTPFTPIVFVDGQDDIEVISNNINLRKEMNEMIKRNNYDTLEKIATRFPYQNSQIGEVNLNIESMLNTVRADMSKQDEKKRQEELEFAAQMKKPEIDIVLTEMSNNMGIDKNDTAK